MVSPNESKPNFRALAKRQAELEVTQKSKDTMTFRKPGRTEYFVCHPTERIDNLPVVKYTPPDKLENSYYVIFNEEVESYMRTRGMVSGFDVRVLMAHGTDAVFLDLLPSVIHDAKGVAMEENKYTRTKREAYTAAEHGYVVMFSEQGKGQYAYRAPEASLGEPQWPAGTSIDDLLEKAFAGEKTITTMDHELVRICKGLV